MLSISLLRYPGGKFLLVLLRAQAIDALELRPALCALALRVQVQSVLLARACSQIHQIVVGLVASAAVCRHKHIGLMANNVKQALGGP